MSNQSAGWLRGREGEMKQEKGWAIAGHAGLYTGWSLTKREAIEHHIWFFSERFPDRPNGTEAKKIWDGCKASGDRAVKVTISWDGP